MPRLRRLGAHSTLVLLALVAVSACGSTTQPYGSNWTPRRDRGASSVVAPNLAWRVVEMGKGVPVLKDVVAVSSRDVWAVGGGINEQGRTTPPSVVRWDGTRLRSYPVARWFAKEGLLMSVAASSSTDVWAAGSDAKGPVILHWDGSGWQRATLPALSGGTLYGVAAITRSDAWAVGELRSRALMLHWDGARWSRVKAGPTRGRESALWAVDGASTDDVWAVGAQGRLNDLSSLQGELVMQWNGKTWKERAFGTNYMQRDAVDAVSPTDVWMIGSYFEYPAEILHGTGRGEQVVRKHDGARDIAAPSPSSVFVVGFYDIVHWDGKRWQKQPAAFLSRYDVHLESVSAISPTDVWAVGERIIARYSR